MAAQQKIDAVKDAVQSVGDGIKNMTTTDGSPQPNSILDEATGEYVSKTELKKRQKQREKDSKKAGREATRQAPPPPKRKAATQEEDESKLSANVSVKSPPYDLLMGCCIALRDRSVLSGSLELTPVASNTSRFVHVLSSE